MKIIDVRIESVHHIGKHWDDYADFLKRKIRSGEIVILNRKRIFQLWLYEFLPRWMRENSKPIQLYERYKNLIIEKDVNKQLNYVTNILISEGYLERVRKGHYRNLWAIQNNIFNAKTREVTIKNADP